MRTKKVLVNLTYSDGFRSYPKTAYWKPGRVVSGFDGHILTENGCWEVKHLGWIYFDKDNTVLEDNTEGYVHLDIINDEV